MEEIRVSSHKHEKNLYFDNLEWGKSKDCQGEGKNALEIHAKTKKHEAVLSLKQK